MTGKRIPAIFMTLALGGVSALLAIALMPAPVVRAQAAGPPPLPMLFQGEVYLYGEPYTEPGELTVRIGDWESRAVDVIDGHFRCADPCLIAGPPSQAYVGQRVTFHLNGQYEANYSFDFPSLSAPAMETVTLRFGEEAVDSRDADGESHDGTVASADANANGEDEDTPLVLWSTLAGIGVLGVAGSVWFLRRRVGRP